MSVRLRIHLVGLEESASRIQRILERARLAPRRWAIEDADALLDALRTEAPRRTGRLARELFSRMEGNEVTFWGGAPYTGFVLHGTAPHDIEPLVKRALAWPDAAHPVSIVHHPGNAPNPFDQRAYDRARPRMAEILQKIRDWVIRG